MYKPNKIKRYHIGTKGEFNTLAQAISWLATGSNMKGQTELFVDSGNHDISDTIAINLPYHLHIKGFDFKSAILRAATGLTNKPMIQITSSVFMDNISLDGSNLANYGTLSTENAIEILGTNYHEFQNVKMNKCYEGIKLIGAGQIFSFNSLFIDLVKGVHVFSDGTTDIDVEVNTFYHCDNAIHLEKSPQGLFHCLNNIITCDVGDVGIVYNPDPTGAGGASYYTYADDPVVSGNSWNNIGTFSSGTDYTRTDGRDANILVVGNAGRPDQNPHFKVNVANNASATTVVAAGTMYKAVFTNGNSFTCKFKLENNKFTYLPSGRNNLKVWIAGNVSVNGTNRNATICLRKNGVTTDISPMTVRCAVSGQSYSYGLIAYLENIVAGDYIEIFVTSTTNGDEVTLQDLTIYAESK